MAIMADIRYATRDINISAKIPQRTEPVQRVT